MNALKILLLQARNDDDPMGQHEVDCFIQHTGLEPHQVVPFDLLSGSPTLQDVKHHDAMMVGGSGDYYVSKGNLPGFEKLLALFQEVVQIGHPTFASCFGYQLMVLALGGEIVNKPDNIEVGSYPLTLTDAGREDPLLGELPETFWAQQGHKDQAARHPEGISNLASSELSPFQAFRIPGKPIWATQFHPELDKENNLYRFKHYLDGYAPFLEEAERQERFDAFRESPEASKLITRFLHLVFG